jgi:uncharacterized damage-inducible protein DinB
MAFDVEDLIAGLHKSREHFLKHLNGLREDQWEWKPYAECKSIRETLAHLIVDDRAALQALRINGEPDYDALISSEPVAEVPALLERLKTTHEELCSFIRANYASADLDTVVSAFGAPVKLASAIPYISSEDYYHSGQVGFIRIASDPAWDYYAAIYGGE